MARGARMGAQRESARETMSDRRGGRDRESRGSSFNESGGGSKRAEQNRKEARDRDTRDRLAEAAGVKKPKVQPRPTVATADDITGRSEIEGFQQGFTNTAQAVTAGNVAGIGLGATAGSLVEAAAEKVGELSADTPSGPLEAAGRTAGKAAATDAGLGLGGGFVESVASLGLSALGPVGQLAKTGLQHSQFEKATFAGEKALQSTAGKGVNRERRDRGDTVTHQGSSISSVDNTSTTTGGTSAAVQAPTVESINPSIGIAKGTDKRKADFSGAIAIRGKKSNKKRGKV